MSTHDRIPLRGPKDTRNDLQKRAFARAILSDDTKRLAGEDVECYIAQSCKVTMAADVIQRGEFF